MKCDGGQTRQKQYVSAKNRERQNYRVEEILTLVFDNHINETLNLNTCINQSMRSEVCNSKH